MTGQEFSRLANNFYRSIGQEPAVQKIATDALLMNYIKDHEQDITTKYKVAFVWICLNAPYWQYAADMIQGAKNYFLPGHDTDYFLWSDMPTDEASTERFITELKQENPNMDEALERTNVQNFVAFIQQNSTVFHTEAVGWPLPTLMRYHLFLQQESILKKYDYIFYCDVDMKFMDIVGDEILGDGLTAAQHPMYALRKEYWAPYEPNQNSTAYIKRPGKIITEDGKPRFMPLYYAGGLQGGKTKEFIKAMKTMKKQVDDDHRNNYIAIWNDESHWNKYLLQHEPAVVLSPSYIYPDSLIEEYYTKVWGGNYHPRLMTLTKKFSTSAEGGEAIKKIIQQ